MKLINGIISVLLGIGALYMMFTAQNNQDLIYMFILLLMAIVFMCFVIMQEQRDELNQIKLNEWRRMKERG